MLARLCALAVSFLLLWEPIDSRAEEERPAAPDEGKLEPFVVRVVDGEGTPVAGAMVGITAHHIPYLPPNFVVDDAGWCYLHGTKSDANGTARIPDGRQWLGRICIVARHAERNLVAIGKSDADQIGKKDEAATITLTMAPACRVSGKLACAALADKRRALGFTNVELKLGDRLVGSFEPERDGSGFYFLLPPGEFTLEANGEYLHMVTRPIAIKPKQDELRLETIDLPATRLGLLEGTPAPELRDVAAWKNGTGVRLADLKGKIVLLDFWGYWCGPCIHRMPDLFELYDRHHDSGLEIVGIHVDGGESEKDPVDSVRKLDEKLAAIRKSIWKDRDVPYPVALVKGTRTAYGPGIESMARSSAAADYGVVSYPTLVLIDRKGNVAGRFYPHLKEEVDRLEAMLGEK